MATDWGEIFRRRPDLDPPGYTEAVERSLRSWEHRQEVKQCKKPKGRGKKGRTKFPGLKHGAD